MPKEVVLIAAVTIDGFIARDNLEITSWSKDLHVFKKQTMGFPVVMGFNTKQTLYGHLKGRETIVINRGDTAKGVLKNIITEAVAAKFEPIKLKFKYKDYAPSFDEETMKTHFTKHYQGYIDKLNDAVVEENIPVVMGERMSGIKMILNSNFY